MPKKQKIQIVLKSGHVITGRFYPEEFEEIYEVWAKGKGCMTFINCEVRAEEVAAVQWEN